MGKGTGKAGTEQLTKSQLENCKRFTPRKVQAFESYVYKGLRTVNVPTADHLPLTADHALTETVLQPFPSITAADRVQFYHKQSIRLPHFAYGMFNFNN